ncbi:N-acetyltransferase [Salipiger sp. IMCC34102]|nr:N-acetyltransferase [Salipiger sp. IMCC34102]
MDLHDEDGALAPRLSTARLTLRPVVPADAPAIVAALSDWEVTRWLTLVPFPYTRADADGWIGRADQSGY